MFSGVFDSIKSEKAVSIRNYSRRRKLKWAFQFCVFLFLVSRPSVFFSFVGPFLDQIFRQLNKHVCVFMFFNLMVWVVYSLSDSEKRTVKKSETNRRGGELENVGGAGASGGGGGSSTVGESQESIEAPIDDSVVEEQIINEKAVISISPIIEVPITVIPEAEEPVSPIHNSNSMTEIIETIPEKKFYRRTESEKFTHRKTKKFQRTNTDFYREPTRLSRSVHEMDIDDFNRIIETFIADQKLYQREEIKEEQIEKLTVLASN